MINVSNLTKKYNDFTAVKGISFAIEKGEIVSFLGPNGAGKTTTLRMLTGFLAPTSGQVQVCGFDLNRRSMDIRRNTGYLPENAPLPPEMRVREYLKYRAAIKGIPRKEVLSRISEVLDRCRLQDMSTRIIATLSKGYRQRTGLADALLSDPPVIILDEPTIGLDPNQIRDFRGLLIELREGHTVLLSTHILSEAEAVSDRVLIIHYGELLADQSAGRIAKEAGLEEAVFAEIEGDPRAFEKELQQEAHILAIDVKQTQGRFQYTIQGDGTEIRPLVFQAAQTAGSRLFELGRRKVSLEDIFTTLVSKNRKDG